MGAALYSAKFESSTVSPELSSPDQIIDAGKYTHKGDFTITFESDGELIELAKRVAAAFKEVPLLGIDILKDHKSSRLYVLEVNAGGNVWHFSSKLWAERRRRRPELALEMKSQFGAFDVAARALVESVHTLAE